MSVPQSFAIPAPGPRPLSRLTPASPAKGKIDHVFIVFLENQPFDRLFADFPGADGDRNQKAVTRDVPWWVPPFEPTHGTPSWRFRKMWGYPFFRGKMGPEERPLYWRWARDYVLADRHRTQRGPSDPNHLQLVAASSAGLNNNVHDNALINRFQSIMGGTPMDKEPPFDIPALPNRLDEAGVTWMNYGAHAMDDFRSLADPANPGHARNSPGVDRFFVDAAAGTLPQVSWIFPQPPEQDGLEAMNWTARVLEAIRTAPGNVWERSAVLLTWDDWGGYYDHVQPVAGETPADFPAGGRVPLMIISPYAKSGLVFHEPTIHASLLSFVEKLHGLAPLNSVDAEANDLMDCFDFTQQPLPAPVTRVEDADVAGLRAMIAPMPKRSLLRRLHLRREPVVAGAGVGIS